MLLLAGLCFGVAGGCGTTQPEWKHTVKEQIPITVQRNKPVQFRVHVRSKANPLGIRCAPETWQSLTNGGTDKIIIQLVSSSTADAKIYWVRPGWLLPKPQSEKGEFVPAEFALIPDTQFLCGIYGKQRGTATVQITFPGGPDEPTPAEIIVRKGPDELKTLGVMLGL